MAHSLQFKPLIRYFNQLEDMGEYFKKTSIHKKKLIEEFNFMSTVPHELKGFYPEVWELSINEAHCSYFIKKVPSLDASQYIVSNRTEECEEVLSKIYSYLTQLPQKMCSSFEFNKNVFENIFQKNLARVKEIKSLKEFDELNNLALANGLSSLQEYCLLINHELNMIFRDSKNLSLVFSHGDLCFSNIIMFDENIYLIDPRGYSGDLENTFRPASYDLAKLSQCVFGNYDLINHEMFELVDNKLKLNSLYSPTIEMSETFLKMINHFNLDFRTVRMVEASLFLSLIPLHKESKKKMLGFLANSISIYKSIR